jgi:hypothetical protein
MLSGKNPVSLAAAALYLATIETKEYTTQLRIAIAADVSTVTVRKRCLEIIQLVRQSSPGLLTSLESTDKLLSVIKDHEPNRTVMAEPSSKSNRGLFLAGKESGGLSDLPV